MSKSKKKSVKQLNDHDENNDVCTPWHTPPDPIPYTTIKEENESSQMDKSILSSVVERVAKRVNQHELRRDSQK